KDELRTPPRLLALAKLIGLKPADAAAIIDRVRQAIAGWREYADTAGVGRTSRQRIGKIIAPHSRGSRR
ncbi:MAG: hypothetical protein K2Q10_02100, partial [Rhodospirillales bacterium]|nr:hypothetical protein [Rhodospirillales bacterium]